MSARKQYACVFCCSQGWTSHLRASTVLVSSKSMMQSPFTSFLGLWPFLSDFGCGVL